jgi:general secretion pathway protein H
MLAVVALVAAIVAPGPRSGTSASGLEAQTARLAALLRHSRATAQRTQRDVDVLVDLAARTFRSPVGAVALPADVVLQWTASTQCPMIDGARALRFRPDGRTCGSVFNLDLRGRRIDVRVDWLTGRVETIRL